MLRARNPIFIKKWFLSGIEILLHLDRPPLIIRGFNLLPVKGKAADRKMADRKMADRKMADRKMADRKMVDN